MKIRVKSHEFAQARIIKGYSQRGLATALKRAVSYICQVENGHRNPSPQVARQICEVLEVDFEVIFFITNVHKSEQKSA
ncbi:helix-turn-helix transcriptional regulator [Brevibacillus sp. Leaf182]|uniref:helix-turn-helix transcriptional regulator n=1 Tax=Brevibacillus sp. Leaf182 TaxID=1736290 RepID=UPI0006F9491C|nr:helix-turn-helix transcriptional regulator [Brevibacillus sp. Leaf182]RAT95684.1 XRE family transcriptional regulator [Brevibacillus sp. Leaf182]